LTARLSPSPKAKGRVWPITPSLSPKAKGEAGRGCFCLGRRAQKHPSPTLPFACGEREGEERGSLHLRLRKGGGRAGRARNAGGEGGIRTHGTSETYTGFRIRRIRPLCHLSGGPRMIRRGRVRLKDGDGGLG